MRRAVHWAHAVQLGREASNKVKANSEAGMRTKVDGIKKFSLAKNQDFEIQDFEIKILKSFVSEAFWAAIGSPHCAQLLKFTTSEP